MRNPKSPGFDVDEDYPEEEFTEADLYVDEAEDNDKLGYLIDEINRSDAEVPLTDEQQEMVLNVPRPLRRAPIVF